LEEQINFFLKFCKKIICYSENIISFPKKYKNKLNIINPLIRKKYYNKKSKENNNNKFYFNNNRGESGCTNI
jgi:UDP-N-acetylglucosamine--N-acetylmuramyl-(pentapeptide) pyrophosphoryl-undecaprenol N-acetylglucosamine transferase